MPLVDDIRERMLAPGTNRSIALGLLWTLLAVVLAGTAIWVALVLSSNAYSFSDRMATAGVIIAGGTLLLALIAAGVAVMAYTAATGQPDLKLPGRFPFSQVNRPMFKAYSVDEIWIYAEGFKQTTGTILLRNESVYAAKNPAVIVGLENLYFLDKADALRSAGWVVIGFASTLGVTAVQWDGGPNYSVHGNSTRQLPQLRLQALKQRVDRDLAGLSFELLADGYRRVMFLQSSFSLPSEQEEPAEQDQAEPEEVPPPWL